MTTRWEYTTIRVDVSGVFKPSVATETIDTALNAAGREGWEAVGTTSVTTGSGATIALLFVMKRAVPG